MKRLIIVFVLFIAMVTLFAENGLKWGGWVLLPGQVFSHLGSAPRSYLFRDDVDLSAGRDTTETGETYITRFV